MKILYSMWSDNLRCKKKAAVSKKKKRGRGPPVASYTAALQLVIKQVALPRVLPTR